VNFYRLNLFKKEIRKMKQSIKIDVVSDVVCPWCYIGKRRLEKAISLLADTFDFEIEYHPFELNPHIPEYGVDNKQYLTEKFGGEDRFRALTDHVASVALQEGLIFNYEKQTTSPNTRKAHALVQMAKGDGIQAELVELLFKAYFTDGLNLSLEKNLIYLGVRAGLDESKIEDHLADENSLLQVALEEQQLYKLGITGVPFYIINQKFGISGAQNPENFIKAFYDITNEKESVTK
jgi:predicted DsbA family dithiol-disulfide isomerase